MKNLMNKSKSKFPQAYIFLYIHVTLSIYSLKYLKIGIIWNIFKFKIANF
jgi:hypothetical protein